MFLGLQEIDHSFLQLLFFPDKYGAGFDKKSSQSRKISGQDGLPKLRDHSSPPRLYRIQFLDIEFRITQQRMPIYVLIFHFRLDQTMPLICSSMVFSLNNSNLFKDALENILK